MAKRAAKMTSLALAVSSTIGVILGQEGSVMKGLTVAMCAAALLAGGTSLEAADKPSVEISGGLSVLDYNFVGTPLTSSTAPLGFVTDVNIGFTDWFSVVGEAGGNYRSDNLAPQPFTVRQREYALLAGPRFAKEATGNITVFGQVLLGTTFRRLATSVETPLLGAGTAFVGADALTSFAWQPGAGVDISLSQRWAVRFQGDYRLTPLNGEPGREITQPRFSSGIVFKP
jgi:opacity protein-like surface antigen